MTTRPGPAGPFSFVLSVPGALDGGPARGYKRAMIEALGIEARIPAWASAPIIGRITGPAR